MKNDSIVEIPMTVINLSFFRHSFSVLILLCIAPYAMSAGQETLWELSEGLDGPESAFYDVESGFVFLSNVGNRGSDPQKNGFISKVTLQGQVTQLKWYEGLQDPKGIRSYEGTLWVSDVTRLVAVDIASGRLMKEVEIQGATFLNDVAVGIDGTVYVSDMAKSTIHQYKDGSQSVFDSGEHLEHPNGLLVVGQTLYVGGWGSGFNPNDFSTNVLGRFFSVNLQTKKKTLITPNPTGHLDGIESDGEDGFIVTDWVNGKVFHITKTGTVSLLQQHQQGAADHAYITSRDILLLPHMLNNTLTAFKMGPFPK